MADLDSDEEHTGSDRGDGCGAGECVGCNGHLRLLDPTAHAAAVPITVPLGQASDKK
jgi:hypothetical protein